MNKLTCLLVVVLVTGCDTSVEQKPAGTTLPIVDLSLAKYTCVLLQTSKGEITLVLDSELAPASVGNFLNYTNTAFYDGTIFHRVINNFMIQGGGFDENISQKETGLPILNEADNGLLNIRGSIAMARTSDPHSATSQFFINTVDNAFLNYSEKTSSGWGYAVFGQVVTGMDVVDSISKVSTGAAFPFTKDVPVENIVITKATTVVCGDVN